MFGDFNEILSNEEKMGGKMRPKKQMSDFLTLLDDCEVYCMGFSGTYKFTWCNRRGSHHSISERLDRFVANLEWNALYPHANVTHGIAAHSDHLPIILQLQRDTFLSIGKRSFRFEAMWVGSSNCERVVKEAWMTNSCANMV